MLSAPSHELHRHCTKRSAVEAYHSVRCRQICAVLSVALSPNHSRHLRSNTLHCAGVLIMTFVADNEVNPENRLDAGVLTGCAGRV